MGAAADFLDGERVHGFDSSSSAEMASGTPMTRSVRAASSAIAWTASGETREKEARDAHWLGYGLKSWSTKTVFPSFLGCR
jgi:hypothetical protein